MAFRLLEDHLRERFLEKLTYVSRFSHFGHWSKKCLLPKFFLMHSRISSILFRYPSKRSIWSTFISKEMGSHERTEVGYINSECLWVEVWTGSPSDGSWRYSGKT